MDTELLWLWCRPAAAALIQPLAGELSRVAGMALKWKKKENKKEKKERKKKGKTQHNEFRRRG